MQHSPLMSALSGQRFLLNFIICLAASHIRLRVNTHKTWTFILNTTQFWQSLIFPYIGKFSEDTFRLQDWFNEGGKVVKKIRRCSEENIYFWTNPESDVSCSHWNWDCRFQTSFMSELLTAWKKSSFNQGAAEQYEIDKRRQDNFSPGAQWSLTCHRKLNCSSIPKINYFPVHWVGLPKKIAKSGH